MWSARSTTGMGGCSLIPGRVGGAGEGREERGRALESGHKATGRPDHSGEGEAAGGTMRWLRGGLCTGLDNAWLGGESERQKKCTGAG